MTHLTFLLYRVAQLTLILLCWVAHFCLAIIQNGALNVLIIQGGAVNFYLIQKGALNFYLVTIQGGPLIFRLVIEGGAVNFYLVII